MDAADRHLPYAAPIEAYGKGGFRFAEMSHRGSLLCLPDGIWATPVTHANEIDEAALRPIFERAAAVNYLLIGTGVDMAPLAPELRRKLREEKIIVETMATGPAIRTYNILLGEGRPIAALLIAVD
ncbi:MAG: Mth938-like domain-containing protein [Xanthobacteraceae bacterium]